MNLPESLMELYDNCTICPHCCGVNRNKSEKGFCKSTSTLLISSIVQHFGEEPILGGDKGVLNIFFSMCNMRCVYCQNYQISNPAYYKADKSYSINDVCKKIEEAYLNGIKYVGFVTPTHFFPHVLQILEWIKTNYAEIITIYNTNAYENIENIKQLEPYIDIYLPDFKYADDILAQTFSDIKNYSKIATNAIKEMLFQRGSHLIYDEEGLVTKGVIIRHLVLPNHIKNSIDVLDIIAEKFSTNVAISLMAQYNPTILVLKNAELNRTITKDEYNLVLNKLYDLGFHRGCVQELSSSEYYNPNFYLDKPFEDVL